MRENTIDGRLPRRPDPAEIVSEEHRQHRCTAPSAICLGGWLYRWPMEADELLTRPSVGERSPQQAHPKNRSPPESSWAGRLIDFEFPELGTPSRGKMSMQRRI
jgi:hypothetical protein